MIRLSLSYCGTLSVSLTAASSPKGRAKGRCRICPLNYNFSLVYKNFTLLR